MPNDSLVAVVLVDREGRELLRTGSVTTPYAATVVLADSSATPEDCLSAEPRWRALPLRTTRAVRSGNSIFVGGLSELHAWR